MGGTFALWTGTYSMIDYSIYKIRGKSTIVNPIAAGCITGGLLSWRCNIITF